MSKTYKMSDIDDVREIVIDLDENKKALAGAKIPVTAVLKMNRAGVETSRNLQVAGSSVKYRVTDADLADDFRNGILSARVHTKHTDGSDGCFPTPPAFLTIVIGEANPPAL